MGAPGGRGGISEVTRLLTYTWIEKTSKRNRAYQRYDGPARAHTPVKEKEPNMGQTRPREMRVSSHELACCGDRSLSPGPSQAFHHRRFHSTARGRASAAPFSSSK